MSASFTLISLSLILLLSGCDPFAYPEVPPLEEGHELEVTTYSADQPASRAAYAGMGTFVIPSERLVIFDPGTGPEDPPRVIRSLKIPNRYIRDAHIDRDGFIWVATPDLNGAAGGGSIRETYVIDPHTGTVHRMLELSHELRAVAGVIVGPELVYLRAWRDGFSGGIGVVDRACVFDASRCEVRFFTELGDVGGSPEQAFHLTDETLYSFSAGNSGNRRSPINKINPQTGEIVESAPYAYSFVFDEESFYTIGYHVPGVNSVMQINKETLEREAEVEIGPYRHWLALDEDRLYVARSATAGEPSVEVYSAETLSALDTLDISAAGQTSAVFGFVAPGVLLLNNTAWLNTETGEVMADAFPLDPFFSHALRLPEGHPLAY